MKEIYTALAKAQGELTNIELNSSVTVKTNQGGSYKFDYATLGQIMNAIRPVLVKYELGINQSIEDGQMVTWITHSSGQLIASKVPLPTMPEEPQKRGSIITYFRRYGLVTALGLIAEDDDDANIAEGNEVKKEFKSPLFQGVSKFGKPYNAYKDANGLIFLDDYSYDTLKSKLDQGLSITEDLEIIKRKQSNQQQ